jgi:hypothetical protein
MNNGINYKIAQAEDLEKIYSYAEAQIKKEIPDDMERMIAIWESRFRKEALEHYLKMGWSFIAENQNQEMTGFFLGQPLLFFQGQTQTLWVECIFADNQKIKSELVEIAYKLSRDKHFQQVLFPEDVQNLTFEKQIPFQKIKDSIVWARTTK